MELPSSLDEGIGGVAFKSRGRYWWSFLQVLRKVLVELPSSLEEGIGGVAFKS